MGESGLGSRLGPGRTGCCGGGKLVEIGLVGWESGMGWLPWGVGAVAMVKRREAWPGWRRSWFILLVGYGYFNDKQVQVQKLYF